MCQSGVLCARLECDVSDWSVWRVRLENVTCQTGMCDVSDWRV